MWSWVCWGPPSRGFFAPTIVLTIILDLNLLFVSRSILSAWLTNWFKANIKKSNLGKQVIGKNTTDSVKSGLIYGYGGMIDSLINKLKNEIEQKGQLSPKVVITGGLAQKILPILSNVIYHNDLTLRGLYLFYQLNKTQNLWTNWFFCDDEN